MPRYIDAENLSKKVFDSKVDNPHSGGLARRKHNHEHDHFLHMIAVQPTADVKEVVHGEWLNFYGDYSTAECSKCAECYEVSPDNVPREEWLAAFKQFYNFCPSCGADMRGEK